MKVDLTDLILEKLGLKPMEEFNLFLGGKHSLKCRLTKELKLQAYHSDYDKWFYRNDFLNIVLSCPELIAKIPKLTELDKKARDYFVAIDCPWVAKDYSNDVCAFKEKPVREDNCWDSVDELECVNEKCFEFLSWKDEPTDLRTLE